ncbi:MAG: DUF1553 domain-containing protein [Bryobacteraceae bacterium]
MKIALIAIAPLLLPAATVEFNRDIRPILSDKCFTCHGPDPANRKTTLRFDMEAGARRAIVPGDPLKSEIVRRITAEDKAVRMPPAYAGHDRLSEREIDLIRNWIEQGAKWEKHWSFLPPKRSASPEVRDSGWARNPIDRFILSRLEREGLKPSPEADKTTLIRRVTLDLTGLPPTPREVDAFLDDGSGNAYEKVIDRLLASPRYAERMAIRWLEAARYADTNGYQTDGVRDMWRWRDWVIDAFHRNMPFDQFTVEQIAGDLLPNATLDQKIATAFHRNHRTSGEGGIVPEEFRVEYVSERVDTTATVWLGLTMGCARCHDHKYDPIRQKDFYRMFAFFNNVPEKGLVYNFGNEEPAIKAPTPEHSHRLAELDHTTARAEQRWKALQPRLEKTQRKWERSLAKARAIEWSVPDGLVLHRRFKDDDSGFDGRRYVEAGAEANFNYMEPFTLAAWIKPAAKDGAIVTRMEDYFEGEGYGLFLLDGKVRLHITRRFTDIGLRVETESAVKLNEWQHVLAVYDGYRYASGVKIYVDGQEQKLKVLFDDLNFPLGPKEPVRIGGGGGEKLRFKGAINDVRIHEIALTPEQAWTVPLSGPVNEIAALAPEARTHAQAARLRLCFLDRFASKNIREAQKQLFEARKERTKYFELIPTVMVMQEMPEPRPTFLLRRGAYDSPGERVTSGVPEFLPQLPEGSNRLGLARWLVDRANPLTARVIVNRFWQMYFGTGLVKTVEDFGSQGEWPLHRDLLDWLAMEFMDSGWNVKAMQKTIVTSATYRQSSKVTPEGFERDPENRLLARGPRIRLSAEMIRDQALAASGLLVEEMGGPPVKPYQPPGLWQELAGGKGYAVDKGEGLYRRSLYTYWKRTIAPPAMTTFDSPNRETCAVLEVRTNTPLQALNLMNDVAYLEASRKLAERMLRDGGKTPEARIGHGWRLVLGRNPKPRETELLAEALEQFLEYYERDREAAGKFLAQGDSPRNKKLDARELAAYSGVASLILNLDEAVTKE